MVKIDLRNCKDFIIPVYKPIYKSDVRYNILYGSRGSAKSIGITQKLLLKTFEPGGNILVCQWTYNSIKDASYSAFIEWISIWKMEDFFEISKAPLLIVNKLTGKKIIFKGLDDASKIKSIVGVEIVFCEEADLISEENFDKLDLSMRGEQYNIQFFLAFNPASPYVWIKEEYIDKADIRDDVFILHTTYLDNPFIGSQFIKKMEYMKVNHPEQYKRDGLGQFTEKEGLVINNELIEDYKPGVIYGGSPHNAIGIDFGFVHNQAFVSLTYYIDTNVLVLNEVIAKSGLTNEEFTKLIPSMYKRSQVCFADSANPDKIKHLNKNGFKFKGANKVKLKVDAYIDFINSLTKLVLKPGAMEYRRESGKWEYIKGTDTPKKVDDDINDAIRYGLSLILLDRLSSGTSSGKAKFKF